MNVVTIIGNRYIADSQPCSFDIVLIEATFVVDAFSKKFANQFDFGEFNNMSVTYTLRCEAVFVFVGSHCLHGKVWIIAIMIAIISPSSVTFLYVD